MPRKQGSRRHLSSRKVKSSPTLNKRSKTVKVLDELAKSLPTAMKKMKSKSKSKSTSKSVKKIDHKIETLNEKISKLQRQLSEQRHLKNIEQHEIGIDSIVHALDELKVTKEDELSKELFLRIKKELQYPDTIGLDKMFTGYHNEFTFGKGEDEGAGDDELILTRIASGADGVVYKCVYKGSTTAIKKIHIPKRVTPKSQAETYKKLMREIYLLSQFNSLGEDTPFLRYHNYLLDGNTLLIMMEFFDGKELESLSTIKNNSDKNKVFKFLISAVFQMHKLHIVHSDLHFQNVLYKNPNEMKIIDMGRAQCYNDEVKHDYCYKTNHKTTHRYPAGFSEGYTQIAPWRKYNCGKVGKSYKTNIKGDGCSMRDLMAGDLWSVLYKSSPSPLKTYLSKKYHKEVVYTLKSKGLNTLDKVVDDFLNEFPSLYNTLCLFYTNDVVTHKLPDEDEFIKFYGIKIPEPVKKIEKQSSKSASRSSSDDEDAF